MYITSNYTGHISQEMIDWFEERTLRHIDLVKKYCNIIAKSDEYSHISSELLERADVHDDSKFQEPEYTPNLFITWQYKCKEDGIDWDPPGGLADQMNLATEYHVKHNQHHPEYHSDKEVGLINRDDRDKPLEELIDATKMGLVDIAEMCCDWCAMGEEKGNSAAEWADKNVNIRWKFTPEQVEHIYDELKKKTNG